MDVFPVWFGEDEGQARLGFSNRETVQ